MTMTKEDVYKSQLQQLGIYNPAFDPEIKTLAQLERRLTRVQKAWSATAKDGEAPSFLNPHYAVIVQLEDKILAHREALGLTPKALRKLKGTCLTEDSGETETAAAGNVSVLELVRQKYAL